MTWKPVAVVTWLAAGHAVLAAIFWGLLNVPESNAAMLGVSLLAVLALLALGGLIEGTAGAWLLPGRSFATALHEGLRAVPAVVLALVAFGICWWLAARIDAWHEAYRGQIDAWLISRFNAPDASAPHLAVDAVAFLLRAILGTSLAVAVLFARLEGGWRAVLRPGWIRAALSRDQLVLILVGVVLFIALPWQLAAWRPERLPPTWVQPAFAAVKLALIYVAIHAGWAICLWAGARNASVAR